MFSLVVLMHFKHKIKRENDENIYTSMHSDLPRMFRDHTGPSLVKASVRMGLGTGLKAMMNPFPQEPAGFRYADLCWKRESWINDVHHSKGVTGFVLCLDIANFRISLRRSMQDMTGYKWYHRGQYLGSRAARKAMA